LPKTDDWPTSSAMGVLGSRWGPRRQRRPLLEYPHQRANWHSRTGLSRKPPPCEPGRRDPSQSEKRTDTPTPTILPAQFWRRPPTARAIATRPRRPPSPWLGAPAAPRHLHAGRPSACHGSPGPRWRCSSDGRAARAMIAREAGHRESWADEEVIVLIATPSGFTVAIVPPSNPAERHRHSWRRTQSVRSAPTEEAGASRSTSSLKILRGRRPRAALNVEAVTEGDDQAPCRRGARRLTR